MTATLIYMHKHSSEEQIPLRLKGHLERLSQTAAQ